MIKKSLEAYFFTLKNKIVFCKKTILKHVRILFRKYRDCVRNFFTSYTNFENETACP